MVIEAVDRDAGRTGETRRPSIRMLVRVAIVAVLLVSVLAIYSVIASRHNRAPYAADAVGASVRMEMVAPGRAQAVVDQLAGPGRLTAPVGELVNGQAAQQLVVGQLTFRTPPNAPKDGQYALFIIDRALGSPVPAVYATGPIGTDVAQGWDGRFDEVAAKYPWLHMLASTRTPDGSGFSHPGMAAQFPPDTPGPVTFTAMLDGKSLPVTDPSRQLTVALVFLGPDDQIYWATRLAG